MGGMKPPFLARLFLLCALALSGLGCASATADAPPKAGAAPAVASSAALLAQMKAEIGDAACDAPAQCRSMPVGAKACGGPEGYLAWSTQRTDEKRLQALADQHAAARKDENARSGMLSNCMMEPNPGATCEAAKCTLLPRGLPAPPSA
jgi:hypothetical protein